MLYLIGLGLDEHSLSNSALEIIMRCKRVYLENYTVDFPYTKQALIDAIGKGKKIIEGDRDFVEGLSIVDVAKKLDVALLIYGSPLTATTHITILEEAKRCKVRCRVIHNASIFDAVAETGLQLYKFGKVASMPAWKKSFKPTSFAKIIQENLSQSAHSLILVDIGLELDDALKQLEIAAKEYKIPLKKIIVASSLGTKFKKIIYDDFSELKQRYDIRKPYCIIIPSKLHFVEKDFLKNFG